MRGLGWFLRLLHVAQALLSRGWLWQEGALETRLPTDVSLLHVRVRGAAATLEGTALSYED